MLRKVAFASTIGTTVEWYDFFIYATASSLVFNKLFFPNLPPLIGTLVSLGTYAAGFLARPVGGLVFGYIGDRFGRKSALVTTLLIVGIATFVVTLLAIPAFALMYYKAESWVWLCLVGIIAIGHSTMYAAERRSLPNYSPPAYAPAAYRSFSNSAPCSDLSASSWGRVGCWPRPAAHHGFTVPISRL
jgi:MFS family permease